MKLYLTAIRWCFRAILPLAAICARAQCFETLNVTASIQYPQNPPPYDMPLIYDAARGLTLGLDRCAGVVYRYDGVAWSNILPPPSQDLPPCNNGGAWVYDGARQVALLLTGHTNTQPSQGFYSYTPSQGWRALTWTGASPPPAYAAVGTFDSTRNRAIFLLRSAASIWETWEWSGSAWEQGPVMTNAEPDSLTFEPIRGQAFLTGTDPTTGFEAVWVYRQGIAASQSAWDRIPVPGPGYEALVGATLVYDPIHHRILRCLGKRVHTTFGDIAHIDVWNWELLNWNRLDPSDDLPDVEARGHVGATYDLNRNLLVLYGGLSIRNVNGTSTTTPHTDTWEQRVLDVVYVDAGNAGSQDGSDLHPYRTVRQAVTGIAACKRLISIQSGDYPEGSLTVTSPVRLEARNGAAIIH